MFQVTNTAGIPFNVRVVSKGARYGRNDCLTYADPKPMIEFYDARFIGAEAPRGQFVSRYYLSDLRDRGGSWTARGATLLLDGGHPKTWFLDPASIDAAMDWAIDQILAGLA